VITGAISLSLDHTPSIEKPFDMFDVLYDKPWTRFGPYLVGMGTGWILASTGGNIKMSKVIIYYVNNNSNNNVKHVEYLIFYIILFTF
jgi:hypothetical protein